MGFQAGRSGIVNMEPQGFWLDNLGRAEGYNSWVLDQAAPHLGRRVLEVGCGSGTFTRLLADRGVAVTGMDIEERFVAAARRATQGCANVDLRVGDICAQDWDGEFDSVIMLDVLEHLDNDRQMLDRLHRALTPGGRIIVKVPAFAWLNGTLDAAVGHRRRYTKAGLRAHLEAAGFDSIRSWYFNVAGIPGWWLNGTVLKRTVPPAGQLALFERLMPLVKAADLFARPFAGISVFAVGTRP
jgi:SAM-dependent methyltransferase